MLKDMGDAAHEVNPESEKPPGRSVYFLLVLAAAVLYLQSFILPHTPIYQGDSSPIFLSEAVRMLRGECIYRNFFELTLPGTQALYVVLFKIFGVRTWVPNLAFVLVGTALAGVTTAIAGRIVGIKVALVPALMFLAFVFTTEPDATHHWYSTLAVMCALLLLMNGPSYRRLALAGMLSGLATLFTQSRGPAAIIGITAFLVWNYGRRKLWRSVITAEGCLCAGFLVVITPVAAYLVSQVGWKAFVYSIVIFPIKFYPLWFWNTSGVLLSEVPLLPALPSVIELSAIAIWLFVHFLMPCVYIVFFVRRARHNGVASGESWDKLMLLAFVGAALLLSVSFSASWLRLCSVSIPALIILIWFIKNSGRLASPLGAAACAASLLTLAVQITVVQNGWHRPLAARIGDIDLLDPDRYEKFAWVRQQTHAGEYVFQASDSDLYYPLDLRDPTQVPFLTASDYTRPEQVDEVIKALDQREVQLVLWSAWLDLPWRHPVDKKRLEPIRRYLVSHYHLVKTFGPPDYEEVWQRNCLTTGKGVRTSQAALTHPDFSWRTHRQH